MKKIYTLILSATLFGTLSAQLTQANHAPANGENYSMWDCGTTANPGAAGNGVTWNFSSLTTNSSTVLNYTATTTTNANYPNANVSVASSANNTAHYKSTSAALQYYGGNISVGTGVAGTLTYTDPAVEAIYPMSLNTTSTAPTTGTVNVTTPPLGGGTFTGTSKVLADGSGTLTLPGGGTYTNVTRVLTTQTLYITAGAPPFVVTATVSQETYNYYAPTIKAPVVSIMTATAATSVGGPPSSQTLVTRNTNAPGVVPTITNSIASYANGAADVRFYPNPAHNEVSVVAGSAEEMTIEMTDLSGRIVTSERLRGSAVLSTETYPAGLYIYKVTNADGQLKSAGRLVIAH